MGCGVEHNNGTGTNMHIVAHQRSLYHSALANKDVVPKLHRIKAKHTAFHPNQTEPNQPSFERERGREGPDPLLVLPGGLRVLLRAKKQYRPTDMATLPCCPGALTRRRSPRTVQSAWIMVLPPRMMFCEPSTLDFRETLLPVSVSMYSPLACFGGIVALVLETETCVFAGSWL